MNWWKLFRYRVGALFSKRRLEQEMTDEIREHLEERAERYIESGMSPEEARNAAKRDFGGVDQLKEQCRDQRSWVWLEQTVKDLRFAGRSLAKSPGFTIICLITLALAIGVNTTAFTLLNRLLFFSQPFHESDRMVQIWSVTPESQNTLTSPADFCDIRDQNAAFEHAAAYGANNQNTIAETGKPAERCVAMFVSADFFPTIGVTAALGRTFVADDQDKGQAAVVLSNAYWKTHFASDPNVLGRTLRFNGTAVPIVGVMPAVLDDHQIWNDKIDLWQLVSFKGGAASVRDQAWYSVVARLKPGATLTQAQTELTVLAARLAHDFPKTNNRRGFRAEPYAPDYMGDLGRLTLWLIMALSLTVLLIGCMNLANLQLVRTTSRSREYAIRLALGASRGQLMRLLLTESLMLSLAGGALGLVVAKWRNSYFGTFFNSPMPLDLRVLAFALIVSAFTGAVFGAIPAWVGSRADINAALKQSGRGATSDRSRHWLRQALIVVQVALALTLLSGAGYLVRGIQRIMNRELHWQPKNILIGSIELPYVSYGDETNVRHQVFTDKFLAALRQLPSVDHAAISLGSPAFALNGGITFLIEGQPPPPQGNEELSALVDIVTQDYFDTYGLHLLQGRSFSETDRQGTPTVALINQAMAEKFWPGKNPVGKRISTMQPQLPGWYEIVGIVNDITYGGDFVGQYPRYHLYMPWSQRSLRFLTFSVHSTSNARALEKGVRTALAGIEPDVAITQLATAEETMTANLAGSLLVRRSLIELAGLGLLLAIVGIYGVIANLTVERTQEVGIRMALGAQRGDVVGLFLRNGIVLALVGMVTGLALSFSLTHFLNQKISMVMPGNDPWMVVGMAVTLAATAVIACWLPARRATKVNLGDALRSE
jgi:predicted permease